jgi:hypothetical protein
VFNIASISLFILLSAQLPRTLNLILENNLVSFEPAHNIRFPTTDLLPVNNGITSGVPFIQTFLEPKFNMTTNP